MTNHRTKLKTLLRELLQFDAADLDFGICRIMNQRRAEIDDFIFASVHVLFEDGELGPLFGGAEV